MTGRLERILNEFIYLGILVVYLNDCIVGVCNIDALPKLFVMKYKMLHRATVLIFCLRVFPKKETFP
jgi:hypothetical protein